VRNAPQAAMTCLGSECATSYEKNESWNEPTGR